MIGYGPHLRFPRTDKASLHEFKQVREALEREAKGAKNRALAAQPHHTTAWRRRAF
jgi:hypothetical protein